jgi:hypothetical protein
MNIASTELISPSPSTESMNKTQHKKEWIIDFYSQKMKSVLTEHMKNNIDMFKLKQGNVFLNLTDFYNTLYKQEKIIKDSIKITRIEIYSINKYNTHILLYDLDFYDIEINRLVSNEEITNASFMLSTMWNMPLTIEYIYPLLIHNKINMTDTNTDSFSLNSSLKYSIFITYFCENHFSMRDELNANSILFLP